MNKSEAALEELHLAIMAFIQAAPSFDGDANLALKIGSAVGNLECVLAGATDPELAQEPPRAENIAEHGRRSPSSPGVAESVSEGVVYPAPSSQANVERTSVTALVAASVEFSKQPMQERHVVLAKGGGYTFAVRPLKSSRSDDDRDFEEEIENAKPYWNPYHKRWV